MKTGDYYNEKRIRQGFEKIKEIYGTGGHFEMTPYPEFKPEGEKVDITIRINEGKQYFVNRITFQGNTTTRDNVIRRELRLYENSVFNTEALKYSRQAPESARLFQAARRSEEHPDRQDGRRGQQGRRQPEAGRAEPQPAVVRRGRVAVRRRVRPVVVLDGELHGPRREPHALDADGRARQRLPDRVHRAVPVRSADHRLGRPAPARHRIPLSVHPGVDGRQPDAGLAASGRSRGCSSTTATTACMCGT